MPHFWAQHGSLATEIGERSMPHQTKPTRRRAPQQIDLFAGEPQKKIDIPARSRRLRETQAARTDLITRSIVEHADKGRIGPATEIGHDL